ncbi:MAG: hypothetical protein WBC04_21760 [Candidatus Acidiferrales bacterium]
MARVTQPGGKTPVRTAGETFRDGSVIELIRNASDPETLELLLWDGHIVKAGPRVDHVGREYAPVRIEPSVSRALCLPTRVAPTETTRELFEATENLLTRYLDQPKPAITKLVSGVFASWLPEFLRLSPVLWIIAPVGSPKHVALQLLSLICRRPLLLADVGRGDLRSLPMWLQPTLVLDEPVLRPAMQRTLYSSSHRGMNTPSGQRLLNLFGPKVVCSDAPPSYAPLESEALRVVLVPVAGWLAPSGRRSA